VGDNAYERELPGDINIASTSNVGDLTPFKNEDLGNEDLRKTPLQGGGA